MGYLLRQADADDKSKFLLGLRYDPSDIRKLIGDIRWGTDSPFQNLETSANLLLI